MESTGRALSCTHQGPSPWSFNLKVQGLGPWRVWAEPSLNLSSSIFHFKDWQNGFPAPRPVVGLPWRGFAP